MTSPTYGWVSVDLASLILKVFLMLHIHHVVYSFHVLYIYVVKVQGFKLVSGGLKCCNGFVIIWPNRGVFMYMFKSSIIEGITLYLHFFYII